MASKITIGFASDCSDIVSYTSKFLGVTNVCVEIQHFEFLRLSFPFFMLVISRVAIMIVPIA